MNLKGRIGVLGGTFDPIHYGHLDAADAARVACGLDTVLLVPARIPPHRATAPQASEYDRFAMTALAAHGHQDLVACDIELRSVGPSFTAVTLEQLIQLGGTPTQLFFITGADAFAEIATWHDYPAVLDRSHFVAISRPGYPAEALRDRLVDLRPRMRRPEETASGNGSRVAVWLVDALTRDVSSSTIRTHLAKGQTVDHLVPPAVAQYITTHALYAASPSARRLHE